MVTESWYQGCIEKIYRRYCEKLGAQLPPTDEEEIQWIGLQLAIYK